LRAIVRRLGAARTYVLGAGLCGFWATRYGALLNADAVISLGGPTDLRSTLEKFRSLASPAFAIVTNLLRNESLPFDLADIISISGQTRLFHVYGANSEAAAAQALRLKDLPAVKLLPLTEPGDQYVAEHLIGSGGFDSLLDQIATI